MGTDTFDENDLKKEPVMLQHKCTECDMEYEVLLGESDVCPNPVCFNTNKI
jgi:hypothetical protein